MQEEFNFKKKFGQNFLKTDTICHRMIDVSNIEKDSIVIEIGPGEGILTNLLLENKNVLKVIAYEIDTDLEDILIPKFSNNSKLDLIFDDFLNRNIKEDLKKYKYNKLYVIANLPYYITTPIILKFINEDIDVFKIVIMIQKEVAMRYSAKPNSKDYGSITVFLNYYFNINKEFIVSRNMFRPIPNVDSMVISLNKKDRLKVNNKDLFFKLVKDSFKFKRKTLRNNLKEYDLNNVSKVLSKYNMDLTIRAEDIPLEVFIDISNNL